MPVRVIDMVYDMFFWNLTFFFIEIQHCYSLENNVQKFQVCMRKLCLWQAFRI